MQGSELDYCSLQDAGHKHKRICDYNTANSKKEKHKEIYQIKVAKANKFGA